MKMDENLFKAYVDGDMSVEDEVSNALRSLTLVIISRFFSFYRFDDDMLSEGIYRGIKFLRSERAKQTDNILSSLFSSIRGGIHYYIHSRKGLNLGHNQERSTDGFEEILNPKDSRKEETSGDIERLHIRDILDGYVVSFGGLGVHLTEESEMYFKDFDIDNKSIVMQSVIRASVYRFFLR